MKDAKGQIIYVGKAKNLRRRLSSYFQRDWKNTRTKQLVACLADIEIILVNSEVEGLILENNLIKQYKPRHNRRLMEENSGYHYIALTGEDLPRFVSYRKNRTYKELGPVRRMSIAKWFGPYVKRRVRDGLLDLVSESFRVRTCNPMPRRVCLRYHLGKCSGICELGVSVAQYADIIARAVAFLSSQHADLTEQMTDQMWEHADKLRFEEARRLRDQIEALEIGLQGQIAERDIGHDQDVIFFGDGKALITSVRSGVIQSLELRDVDLTAGYAEACEHFLLSHYAKDSPAELIVNHLRDLDEVERALTSANGWEVKVTVPQEGTECELLKFCEQNYVYRVSNGG